MGETDFAETDYAEMSCHITKVLQGITKQYICVNLQT